MAASRKMSVILAEDCGIDAAALSRLLPAFRMSADISAVKSESIRALMAEKPMDALVLGTGDYELAADISSRTYTTVLVLAEERELQNLRPACIADGILCASLESFSQALPQLLAVCTRMRILRLQNYTLRRKLDDTRLVSRAKLLLMSRLKMSEAEAHRYIEKTAMDSGAKLRDIAESIIRTYEE